MNIQKIVNELKDRYNLSSTDFSWNTKKGEYLSECIIPSDIMVISGRGASVKTNKGELTDLASMTVNCILGQNDPWVNANLIAYLLSGRPSFLTTRLGSEYYYKVAKRICDITKFPVINHRQCNGTDVTELAVLAAFRHRKKGRNTLVSFRNSYHGQGLTAYLSSGLQRKHLFLINDKSIIFLDDPDHTSNLDTEKLSDHDKTTLNKLYELRDEVFAVIIEPIQVNNAVNTPSKAFMKKLKEICTKSEIALIFDEVQTGFGWLGKMTAAERYDVKPNLMAVSKALTAGNGPFSALVSDKIYQDVQDGTGAKTNGADIRSLIACNAVIDRLLGIDEQEIPHTIEDSLYEELQKGLLYKFDEKKELLYSYLVDLQGATKGMIPRIKGAGLIRGIEIVNKKGDYDHDLARKIQLKLLDNGVLVRNFGYVLIIKPPIVITERELDRGFAIIKKTINRFN